MRYERDLQVRLRNQYRRLFKADYHIYKREAEYFRTFITESPVLLAVMESMKASTTELDADKWLAEKFTWQVYDVPETEAGRAKVAWRLIEKIASGEIEAFQFATNMPHSSGDNIDTTLRYMTEKIIEPLVDFLEERIGTESNILYILEKLKRRIEWFDRDELYKAYEQDTRHGEDTYDRYVRKFLFDQGVDYPFSQPSSASGEVDIVSGLEGEDPLVEETKLYDGEQYNIAYVAKGLNQAVQYAQDYSKTTAHLIVINLSEHNLQLPSDEETKIWPARLYVGGITVYLVIVRARPLPSASNGVSNLLKLSSVKNSLAMRPFSNSHLYSNGSWACLP